MILPLLLVNSAAEKFTYRGAVWRQTDHFHLQGFSTALLKELEHWLGCSLFAFCSSDFITLKHLYLLRYTDALNLLDFGLLWKFLMLVLILAIEKKIILT